MTITLSDVDYWELWEESNQSTQHLPDTNSDTNSAEVIQKCPKQLGKGYRRHIQLRDKIQLLIHDYELDQDLSVNYEADISPLEFGFQVSGSRSNRDGRNRNAGQNFLQSGANAGITRKELAKERILQVDIHLENPYIVF